MTGDAAEDEAVRSMAKARCDTWPEWFGEEGTESVLKHVSDLLSGRRVPSGLADKHAIAVLGIK